MITVTAEQKAIIEAPGRTFRASLIFGNVEYDGVVSFLHTQSLAPNGGITIGEAISASLEVETTDDISNAQGVEFAAQYALEDGSEDGLSFPLGLFYADKPVKSGSLYKLTAYDRMVKAEKVTYQSNLTYPTDTTAIFNEIVTKAGFPDSVVTPSRSYTIEKDALSGYNCRQALAYLAAYMGCNCFVNKDGDFAMLDYTAVSKANFNLSDNTMDVPDIGEGTVTVNNLLCAVDEETTLSSGTAGGKAITFVCPFMTQAQLNALLSKFNGSGVALYNYSTATISQLCGDPRIELGDVIVMTHNGTDYNVPVMQLVRDFDGGLWVKIDSFDTAPVEGLTVAERIDLALRAVKNPSKYAAAAAEFSELINNAIGMYTTTETLPDGSTKMYIHDKPTLAASTYIATINSNGFATTNDWNNGNPVWTTGIDRNGNAILTLLTVYKLRAEQIEAGAITIGGLGQDVLDLIEQGGDGIDVHATAGTISTNNYPLTTTEQVTELTEGQTVEITFPNGIDFSLNTSGSTYLYKPRTVSIVNNTYTLLNANGTTDWCNVKNSTDYASNVAVKYIVRTISNTLVLCELIETENVLSSVIECETGTPTILELTEAVSNPATGTVLKCDVSQLTYGMAITSTSSAATNCSSPKFSWDRNNFKFLLSKAHYNTDKRFADAYSLSELYSTGTNVSSVDYSGTLSSNSIPGRINISGFSMRDGVKLAITFTFTNTNSANSYPIYVNDTAFGTLQVPNGSGGYRNMVSSDPESWSAGDVRILTYDANRFAWIVSIPIYYFTPKTETEPTGVSSVNIILENLRTSNGTELRAFELRFDPYSTAPVAIDQEARDAADRALLAALAAQSDIDNLDIEGDIADYMQTHPISSEITTWYGTCGTAAGTAAKVVTCSGFTLKVGAIINVSFTNANTATTPTLNVNSTGAKNIYVNGAQLKYGSSYATNAYNWKAGNVVQFMYNGSVWIMSQTSADLILANWCADNDMTVIDGSKIYAGTVTSKKIQANSIYATDALLGNLLACYATITGRVDCKASATANTPTSTELDAVGNALFGTSYSSASTIVKTFIMSYATIFKNAFQSKLRVGFMNNGTYYPSVFLTPMGMIAGTGQDQITESNFIEDIFTNKKLGYYGVNAWIPGGIWNNGKRQYYESGTVSGTFPNNSDTLWLYVDTSNFQNGFTLSLTAQNSNARVSHYTGGDTNTSACILVKALPGFSLAGNYITIEYTVFAKNMNDI